MLFDLIGEEDVDLLRGTGTNRAAVPEHRTVARLVLIGVALAVVAGAFAYLGAWLTPNNLTPARFTDALPEAPFMTGWGPKILVVCCPRQENTPRGYTRAPSPAPSGRDGLQAYRHGSRVHE